MSKIISCDVQICAFRSPAFRHDIQMALCTKSHMFKFPTLSPRVHLTPDAFIISPLRIEAHDERIAVSKRMIDEAESFIPAPPEWIETIETNIKNASR